MKKNTLILLLFISNFAIAQKFKTSVMLSPGISWYASSNSEVGKNNSVIKNNGMKFCFSITAREDFYFSKIFSLGIEFGYLNTNGSFTSPTPLINTIPEIHNSFRHTLSVNSIDIPIAFKIRTDSNITKGIYFYLGSGLSYIFQSNRIIDIVTTYDYSPDKKDISPVTRGTATIKNDKNNQVGSIGILGFGKNFIIKNKTFFCEAKYRFDLNKWIYPTVNDPLNNSFDIKRQSLLLSFGITF